jgi:hypothetical protein
VAGARNRAGVNGLRFHNKPKSPLMKKHFFILSGAFLPVLPRFFFLCHANPPLLG